MPFQAAQVLKTERADIATEISTAFLVHTNVFFVVSGVRELLEAMGALKLGMFQNLGMRFPPVLLQLLHSCGCLITQVAL